MSNGDAEIKALIFCVIFAMGFVAWFTWIEQNQKPKSMGGTGMTTLVPGEVGEILVIENNKARWVKLEPQIQRR